MAGLQLQTSEHAGRFISETALVPTACHSLTGGSSNPPKFGTLIPNRIFVGGIPSNTTEQELKSFFSNFGQVKDVKIISDRLGVSKGSYGFVTFESQEMAEKIIKNESETLIFKDRKLNIGHAIRKQQLFPRPDLPTALFFAGGAMPYGFQNGMAVFSLPGQEYPVLTQAATPYATMMLPQPGGGTALYLPSSLQSAMPAAGSPYAQLSQQQVTAALQQHQYHQPGGSTVTGQMTPVTVSTNNVGTHSSSTAAVMAAAAAMAAAVQWPQQTTQTTVPQSSQQLSNVTTQSVPQPTGVTQAVVQNTSITPQQAAAMAAAVAAQHQAAWRWSPTVQQSQSQTLSTTSSHVPTSSCATTSSAILGSTTSTPALHNQNLQPAQQVSESSLSFMQPAVAALPTTIRLAQQPLLTASTAALFAAAFQPPGTSLFGTGPTGVLDMTAATALAALASMNQASVGSPTAAIGPATYLYSPIAGTGHELMFFQHTSSPFAANSTSDYSTDHSTHSSGLLESVEPLSFPCDATPLGRHSQQLGGQITGTLGSHLDAACLSPYAAFAPLLDFQQHAHGSGQHSTILQSNSIQQIRQTHHQPSLLTAQQAASAQQFVPIAHGSASLVAQTQQQPKMYSQSALSSLAHTGPPAVNTCALPSSLYGTASVKVTALTELGSTNELPVTASIPQSSLIQPSISVSGSSATTANGLSGSAPSASQLQQPNTANLNPGTTQGSTVVSALAVDSVGVVTGGHR
ncbi:Protein boule [Fasciola hepatica]|uniref:Protein boule n=1 Tax=Fasciola hepatica TaxID=6192 RepID=A0A4E0R7V1_FASHE|nr:Protein boule [Fasciola hepatica]